MNLQPIITVPQNSPGIQEGTAPSAPHSKINLNATWNPEAPTDRRPPLRNDPSQRGSALLLVIGASALMTLAVFGTAQLVTLSLVENASKNMQFRARVHAESGISIGLHPEVHPTEKVLKQTLAKGPVEKFEVKLSNEGGRLKINDLLQGDKREARRTLVNLFYQWGLRDKNKGSEIVDCLFDWVDADDLKHLNGAEQEWYFSKGQFGYPFNRPFRSLDEIGFVKGMDAVQKLQPRWKDYFTLWGDGKLNLNYASPELIALVCNLSSRGPADAFVRSRHGPDGKPDTADDILYTDLNKALSLLGLPESSLNSIAEKVSLEDKYWRVESTGWVGDYQHKIAVVADRTTNPIQFLEWQEQ
jgi:general secretion pathway protein K